MFAKVSISGAPKCHSWYVRPYRGIAVTEVSKIMASMASNKRRHPGGLLLAVDPTEMDFIIDTLGLKGPLSLA